MSITHSHPHSPVRAGRALLWAILLNIVITISQFVAGFLTGFLSLVADAAHNLSDVASLILAYIGERSSQLPATKSATFGHKRVEVFIALVSAVALLVVSGMIVYSAYERLSAPQEHSNFTLFFVVAGIGLAGNLASALLLRGSGSASLNMRLAVMHLLADAATSAAVIIGGVVILYTGWWMADIALALLIAVVIVWSSFDVFARAWRVFMEVSPKNVNFDAVITAIEGHAAVINAHDLHIWSLSSTETALSCHITVTAADLNDVNQIIADLNKLLHDQFGVEHCTLQVETEGCHRPDAVCGPINRVHNSENK